MATERLSMRQIRVKGSTITPTPERPASDCTSALAQPAGQASNASISHTVDARITFPP
jgi:hypothetical protein